MPGILLTILKIIGIVLAVLLGLLILLLCLVLFVPIRYETKARFAGTFRSLQFRISFTWFFKQIRVDLIQKNGVFHWQIKIFWFKRRGPTESAEAVKEEVEEEVEIVGEEIQKGVGETVETEAEEVVEKLEEEPGEAPERVEKTFEEIESAATEKIEHEEQKIEHTEAELEQTREQSSSESESGGNEESGTGSAPGSGEKEHHKSRKTRKKRRSVGETVHQTASGIVGFLKKLWNGICSILNGTAHIFDRIKCTFKAIYDRILVVNTARETFLWFIHEEAHGNAWQLVRKELKYLGLKIKPKEAQVRIRYGFEDPYYTGRLLADFAILYAFVANVVEIIPDYEKRILRARLYLKGGLRLWCLLVVGIRLVSNKDVRITYHNIMKTISNGSE